VSLDVGTALPDADQFDAFPGKYLHEPNLALGIAGE
jgi:hypothetical protein